MSEERSDKRIEYSVWLNTEEAKMLRVATFYHARQRLDHWMSMQYVNYKNRFGEDPSKEERAECERLIKVADELRDTIDSIFNAKEQTRDDSKQSRRNG